MEKRYKKLNSMLSELQGQSYRDFVEHEGTAENLRGCSSTPPGYATAKCPPTLLDLSNQI
ncbi:unnamed protein product [Larinioides sclopetarius]|uniref:Uncharacterized protein n=1 Tax=Larinioides sclopetarius TaxID=280406 RepID=A0AAV2BWN6_9ARAC